MQVSDNMVVSFHYTLKDENGEIMDSSEGQEPLNYLHGSNNIVPGLEKALTGKSVNDALEVSVSPEEGYGPVHQEMIQQVPLNLFTGIDKVEVGMEFQAQGDQGEVQPVVITAIEVDMATVDGNHPLAGKTLNFSVTITEIRDASPEEVDHGHVH